MLRFPAVWLRDNCPCPECVAPGTTQKVKDITERRTGWHVASGGRLRGGSAALRAADAASFGTLTRTPAPFGYVDKATELRASQPLIELSPRGRVRGVRFNNRSMRSLRGSYAGITAFYAAYRRWAELLAGPNGS